MYSMKVERLNGTKIREYKLTFKSTWSKATHPVDFPQKANMSPIVGVTHNNNISLWSAGGKASQGMRNLAEVGSINPLHSELSDAIRRGSAGSIIEGPPIMSPGKGVTNFYITSEFPLVTLATKISPSPDWFTGVSSLSLKNMMGKWVRKKKVLLYPYDAGTDSGVNYNQAKSRLQIQGPVSRIKKVPFEEGPIGELTFELIN